MSDQLITLRQKSCGGPMIRDVMSGQLELSATCYSLVLCSPSLLASSCSGCPPFYGSNSDAIHDMILTEEADFTSKRFSHVSALALDFLQKVARPTSPSKSDFTTASCERYEPSLDSSGSFGTSLHTTGPLPPSLPLSLSSLCTFRFITRD